jgi:hypothetical protein
MRCRSTYGPGLIGNRSGREQMYHRGLVREKVNESSRSDYRIPSRPAIQPAQTEGASDKVMLHE